MGGKGNVVIIERALASSASVAREQGARDIWKAKYPAIKVLAAQPGNYIAEQAHSIMQDFIQRFGSPSTVR
jgi:ABC-type sugar transport system substrate-binding protein